MMRNDYRRALILLRSNAADHSGHVRLERRTLMGSMYFVLRTPRCGATLYALLAGRGKDAYYACVLGRLRRDESGQATLGWNFNPRDICGRELDQYQKIVIAEKTDTDCNIVMFGNVGGFAEMNWERVRQAVCISLESGPERSAAAAPSDLNDVQPDDAQEDFSKAQAYADDAPAEADRSEPVNAQTAQTAAEVLELDTDAAWPEQIESLRRMFAQQPLHAQPPQDEYTYISAPMPQACGFAECAVGLRADGGVPVAVCYALHAPYSAQPPAGMEDYYWQGDANRGWWKLEIPVER